jgi:hypothetical protein
MPAPRAGKCRKWRPCFGVRVGRRLREAVRDTSRQGAVRAHWHVRLSRSSTARLTVGKSSLLPPETSKASTVDDNLGQDVEERRPSSPLSVPVLTSGWAGLSHFGAVPAKAGDSSRKGRRAMVAESAARTWEPRPGRGDRSGCRAARGDTSPGAPWLARPGLLPNSSH